MAGSEDLIAIAAAFFVVTISPGPANIAVAAVAMHSGRGPALRFAVGLSSGLALWGLVAATGLGLVLQSASTALATLKVLGGLYLMWLAYQAARSATRPDATKPPPVGKSRWFSRGLLLNLSNPKAVVAWMAALSMGLGQDAEIGSVMAATALCMVLGLGNYIGYALTFSLSGAVAGYRRGRRWIDGALAGLFAMAGFSLIRSAFAR